MYAYEMYEMPDKGDIEHLAAIVFAIIEYLDKTGPQHRQIRDELESIGKMANEWVNARNQE